MNQSRALRIAIATLLVLFTLGVVGWWRATSAFSSCLDDTLAEVRSKNIRSPRLDGTIITGADIKPSAKVMWPFVVSVAYFIPQGLHASYHENIYVVLPWQTIKRPQDPVYFL